MKRRILRRWKGLDWDGWWGDSMDARFELAAKASQVTEGRVLDLGCGVGVILAEVPSSAVRVGLDRSVKRLRQARNVVEGECLLVCGDLEHLPFRSASFDVLILGNVLEIMLMQDRAAPMREAHRLLAAGGKAIATTPNHDHPVYRRNPSLATLEEAVRAFADFRVAKIYGYNPVPCVMSVLPQGLARRIPAAWGKFLCIPSPLLARIPGMEGAMRRLMHCSWLRRRARAFVIMADV